MRILVIEDEKEVANLVRRAMAEESHAVDVAYDGLAGEDYIASETYDLIILDLMLPKKDGLAVLKTLRKEEIATPVLLLTARECGRSCGANPITKLPFSQPATW